MTVWGAITLRVGEEVGELLLAGLGRAALGAEVHEAALGTSRVVVYVRSREDALEVADWIRGELVRHGLDPAAAEVSVEDVADRGWVELYQSSLTPFALGGRFTVYPKGRLEGEPAAPRIALLVEPGRAFGTGEHPTTRLCAQALERVVLRDSEWIDLGCGTGILALVARHCGARSVLALDEDAEAIEVARAVVALNGVRGIELVVGSTADARSPVDGVVANILAPFFLARGPALAGLVREGGTVVVSGFLVSQIDEVRIALSRSGLVEESQSSSGEWAALVLRSAACGRP